MLIRVWNFWWGIPSATVLRVLGDTTFSHDFCSTLNGRWVRCYSFLVLTWDAPDLYVGNGPCYYSLSVSAGAGRRWGAFALSETRGHTTKTWCEHMVLFMK